MNFSTQKQGIVVVLIWLSLAFILFPTPNEDLRMFERFLMEEMDGYLDSKSEQERTAYARDPNGYVDSVIADAETKLWIVWILKLGLIGLGVLGGVLMYFNRSYRLVLIVSAALYLAIVNDQLIKSLPAWDLPVLEAYWMFLKRGNVFAADSLLFQILFYHQYLIFPILQLLIVGLCGWKIVRGHWSRS